MAVINYIGDRFVGTSTELGTTDATNGSIFFTTDTLKVYLRHNESWEEIDVSQLLSGLGDVDLGNVQDEQVLAYNTSTSKWENFSLAELISDISELNDLTDVNITSVSSGEYLRYDGNEWVNDIIHDSDIAESAVTQHESALTITESQISDLKNYLTEVSLDDLTDTNLSNETTGDLLIYNGSDWVNTTLGTGDIPDLSNTYQLKSEKNQANGYVGLNSSSKISTQYLPALAITEVFVVDDIDARDDLIIGSGEGEVQEGDVSVVEDASDDPNVGSGSASYIYDGSDWQMLQTPDVTAAGANTQIQFNDNGSFGASSNFNYDDGEVTLTGLFTMHESNKSPQNLSDGEATYYVEVGTEGNNDYTRTMLRMGDVDYIVSTHIY